MIYLDHNATTPVRPGVVRAMTECLEQPAGNPSSVHWAGRSARQRLDGARRAVAGWVGVHESRVIFTSGGTEANNLALFGLARAVSFQGTLIISAVEHPSVLQAAGLLAHQGMNVIRLPVDGEGRVDPDDVAKALVPGTVLVSVMAANNETGVLQPVEAIGRLCREAGVVFHTDATQWAGRLPLAPDGWGAGLLTLSAHKLGGPRGVGALIVDPAVMLVPTQVGGGQERGRRAGTENLPGIVGFGVAAQHVAGAMAAEMREVRALRERLENRLLAEIPALTLFGGGAERLPNTTAVGLSGLDGETLVMTLDLAGCAVSSGAACSSGRTAPSHVLVAMGVEPALNQSAVRISLGRESTTGEVDQFVALFSRSVDRLRKGSLFA